MAALCKHVPTLLVELGFGAQLEANVNTHHTAVTTNIKMRPIGGPGPGQKALLAHVFLTLITCSCHQANR